MEEDRLEKLSKETAKVELELDGKIFVHYKDKDNNLILKEELDGEVALRVLLSVFESSIDYLSKNG